MSVAAAPAHAAVHHGAVRRYAATMPVAVLLTLLLLAWCCLPARAAAGDGGPAALSSPASSATRATVMLGHRRIADLRATLAGDAAEERAAMAGAALEEALARGGPGRVSHQRVDDVERFEVDGVPVFYLAMADLPGLRSEAMLTAASQKVERRLVLAVREAQEAADPRRWLIGAAWSLGATLCLGLMIRGVLRVRVAAMQWCHDGLERWPRRRRSGGVWSLVVPHLQGLLGGSLTLATWALIVLWIDLWVTFVLDQFAYTRPWGERSTAWLLGLVEEFALAAFGAVPGLLTVLLILLIARWAARLFAAVLGRIERGELRWQWVDADTAVPTRRIGIFVIWLFALALAYPYLPGSSSDSFKGVSVLAGLMLSLGASGVVGQAMSGVGLMYSRALRVGEYVRIGETEGTVSAVGLFATRLQTGLGEELSLPNTFVVAQPVRNFSRLVRDGRFVLHTAVTIGYATPWRQVHALLLEAARRTAGVAQDPAPYVVQTALSDFYVEYRLCAQADRTAPQRRAEALNQLLGHIQDVFNENAVQIMSPHYIADPPVAQVVPPGDWFAPRSGPLGAPGSRP